MVTTSLGAREHLSLAMGHCRSISTKRCIFLLGLHQKKLYEN